MRNGVDTVILESTETSVTTIKLNKGLNEQEINELLFSGKKLAIGEEAKERLNKSHEFLKEFADKKIIYGVNTGFGPMAQYRINDKDLNKLQYNLIRSHSSGIGQHIPIDYVRAAMLARINTLSLGYSGIDYDSIELMKELFNRNITPVIYEHGGVGASGDLVQLAHLALVLIGEGEVFYKGKQTSTKKVFKIEKLKPIKIVIREGLALMNGTSVMTGIGLVNVFYAKRLLGWMLKCSVAINEIVEAYDDHLSMELNGSKLHSGQNRIAELMREKLKDSKLTRNRAKHLYNGFVKEEVFKEKVQEYYSLRCVPQILGPVLETIDSCTKVLIEEINSANDNPIMDFHKRQVYHGGNFHGDYVSLEMDKLKLVITKLSMLSERQLNYLLNSKLNNILPPFVNLGKLGLNFGIQGMQFTATSTTAENQMLSNSMYVHSIPNNNDNQDIVSMGTNSSLITKKVIDNAFQVVCIELIAILQAVEFLKCEDRLSSESSEMVKELRKYVPVFSDDIVMYPIIRKVNDYIFNND